MAAKEVASYKGRDSLTHSLPPERPIPVVTRLDGHAGASSVSSGVRQGRPNSVAAGYDTMVCLEILASR